MSRRGSEVKIKQKSVWKKKEEGVSRRRLFHLNNFYDLF